MGPEIEAGSQISRTGDGLNYRIEDFIKITEQRDQTRQSERLSTKNSVTRLYDPS